MVSFEGHTPEKPEKPWGPTPGEVALDPEEEIEAFPPDGTQTHESDTTTREEGEQ